MMIRFCENKIVVREYLARAVKYRESDPANSDISVKNKIGQIIFSKYTLNWNNIMKITLCFLHK